MPVAPPESASPAALHPAAAAPRLFGRLESRARGLAMAVIAIAWLLPFLMSAGVVLSFMAMALGQSPNLLAAADRGPADPH